LQSLVEDKLREMLEAETINDLQKAYYRLEGLILAGAPAEPEYAKKLYLMRLEQFAPADDIPNIHPAIKAALSPFIGGLK
jgi:hypothetical protein